jgi:hypothetical protein
MSSCALREIWIGWERLREDVVQLTEYSDATKLLTSMRLPEEILHGELQNPALELFSLSRSLKTLHITPKDEVGCGPLGLIREPLPSGTLASLDTLSCPPHNVPYFSLQATVTDLTLIR